MHIVAGLYVSVVVFESDVADFLVCVVVVLDSLVCFVEESVVVVLASSQIV